MLEIEPSYGGNAASNTNNLLNELYRSDSLYRGGNKNSSNQSERMSLSGRQNNNNANWNEMLK